MLKCGTNNFTLLAPLQAKSIFCKLMHKLSKDTIAYSSLVVLNIQKLEAQTTPSP